tara:strand:+ start:704 stop:1078 length:375 start_codon:yes stop_codon:yes gene_type:complete
MSTLNVSNITDGTDTVGTSYVVNGSAKAWVNFNGTGTIAIRDSLNIGSLTDNGTGDYNVNFSANMANSNYCAVLGHRGNRPGDGDNGLSGYAASTYELNSRSGNQDSSKEDSDRMHSSIFGDLA